jgi:hypothetical protein
MLGTTPTATGASNLASGVARRTPPTTLGGSALPLALLEHAPLMGGECSLARLAQRLTVALMPSRGRVRPTRLRLWATH